MEYLTRPKIRGIMFKNILQSKTSLEKDQNTGYFILKQLDRYLLDLLVNLDAQIDKRLVRTFYNLCAVIIMFRNRSMGLLLSELGGYITGFNKAPAGTKRISNLLRSKKWEASLIDQHFFQQTKDRVQEIEKKGKRALMLWDDSRIEKHESWFCEGLCSVWSSKAKRLTRIKKGFFTPPSTRICVPGFKWTGVFLSHLGGVPSVCQMTWWTTRGKFREDPDNIIFRLLQKTYEQLGTSIVHILDRGYASIKMLDYLIRWEQDFVIRWKKNQLLFHQEKGKKKTHLLSRSFRGKKFKRLKDQQRKTTKKVTIAWAAVNHPEFMNKQCYLVIVRDKKHHTSPMYLLTSLPINNAKQAWEVLFSYMHRWEVEQGFRFLKSEMAIESPRLWFWDNRMKIMAIVTLVYDFLLQMVRNWGSITQLIFKRWCHRTGERYRLASIPLYRFRSAFSNCLFSLFFAILQNSG